jgi:hypothetical protein
MSFATEDNKLIARTVAKVFGTKPSVSRYWDDNHKSYVDLLVCCDSPTKNVNSYSTVSLSDYPIGIVGEMQLGVEIVAACQKTFLELPNALATCAFNIINSGYTCSPGTIFPNVIKMYNQQLTMKHALFVSPFLWEENFSSLTFKTKKIAWLMMVPISESEFNHAREKSVDDLENIFKVKQINIFDINRKSAI